MTIRELFEVRANDSPLRNGFLVANGARSLKSIAPALLVAVALAAGCGGPDSNSNLPSTGGSSAAGDTGGATSSPLGGSSSAGADASGGVAAAGGASATGGAPETGGVGATGGAKTTGGVTATGGRSSTSLVVTGGTPGATGGTSGANPTGGVTAAGGASASGGTKTIGGATASGGTLAIGGASSMGGVKATGGSVGAGGATSSSSDLWIATDGLDTNPGTEAQPFLTLTYAHTKVNPGQTIWIKPGTYKWSSTVKLTKNGTASSPINVFAAAGARPVIDFSAQTCGDSAARGIAITGTYWHLKGFDVQKAGDNCIHIGGSYNTVEWVVTHNCCDSGLQITADTASDATRGAYNTVLNCDSYENYDTPTGGENADGFAPKLHIGPGNVFRGCRSWNNADDGYDLFASDDIVTIDHCWAFMNGVLADGSGTSAGDGNGFKLGGAATAGDAYEGGAVHQVTASFAFENTACGFTRNNNTSVPVLSQCGGRADGKGEYCSLTNPSPVTFTMTGAQAKALARNADGSLPAIH